MSTHRVLEDDRVAVLEAAAAEHNAASDETPDVENSAAVVLPFDTNKRRSGVLQARGARTMMMIAESFAIVLTSVVSGFAYHTLVLGTLGDPLVFLATGLLAAILFAAAMRVVEANQLLRRPDAAEAIRDMTLVWAATVLSVTFFAFSLKAGGELSRGTLLTFVVLGWMGIFAVRTIAPALIVRHYRPQRAHQVIVISAETDPSLDVVLSELSAAGYAAPRVVRFNAKSALRDWRRELAGSMMRVLDHARTADNGEICIAAGGFDDRKLRDVVLALQVVPRAVRIIPTPQVEQLLHYPIRNIGGLHSVELQKAPLSKAQTLAKRTLDLTFASLALLALSPLFLFIAVAMKVDSRGPILFKQTRLGHRSKPFAIYKFRSMTVSENGADVKQAEMNDRRVTRLGRWLRRTSIDELPQLINVVRGEMSLVGPRPHAVAHDQHYATLIENYEIRQHVKPGITGWAQVNGLRGETSSPDLMRRRVEADIWYAKNASLLLDIRILLQTVVEVLRQRNAY